MAMFVSNELRLVLEAIQDEVAKSGYEKISKFEICYVKCNFDPATGCSDCEAGVPKEEADVVSVYFVGEDKGELALLGCDMTISQGEHLRHVLALALEERYDAPLINRLY